MHTMDQHLAQLVSRGEITYEAGREKAQDLDGYERLVQAGSTNRGSGANLAAGGNAMQNMR